MTEEIKANNLVETMRGVETLDGGYPLYQSADICLQTLTIEDVYPTALYVLKPNFGEILAIRRELLLAGIDIFDLDEIEYCNGVTIAPPVVEEMDGVLGIVDGIHRFYLAGTYGVPINTIVVRGVDRNYPFISYPVFWEDVSIYDIPPENPHQRRRLRHGIENTSECRRLYYRDLSFLGGKGRRPLKVQ
jgi:hypothetical protein